MNYSQTNAGASGYSNLGDTSPNPQTGGWQVHQDTYSNAIASQPSYQAPAYTYESPTSSCVSSASTLSSNPTSWMPAPSVPEVGRSCDYYCTRYFSSHGSRASTNLVSPPTLKALMRIALASSAIWTAIILASGWGCLSHRSEHFAMFIAEGQVRFLSTVPDVRLEQTGFHTQVYDGFYMRWWFWGWRAPDHAVVSIPLWIIVVCSLLLALALWIQLARNCK